MSLDLRTLYPNFHAESTRHPSSSPRPTSSKGSGRQKRAIKAPPSPTRKWRDRQLPHAIKYSKQSLPSSSIKVTLDVNQTEGNGNTGFVSRSRSIPPLCVSACGPRPSTPEVSHNTSAPDSQREFSHEVSFAGTVPLEAQEPFKESTYLRTTRSLVLRGDLAKGPDSSRTFQSLSKGPPRLARTAPALVSSSSLTSFASIVPAKELIQCDARPRSRYARRENAPVIQPLMHRLSTSASSPAISPAPVTNQSIGDSNRSVGSGDLRACLSTGAINSISVPASHVPPKSMLSWTEQDASSFFLTEIDAKDAEDQWAIARALAEGSHLLYAKAEYERAVARFADALNLVQPATPLAALLHHHMGIAFFEDGHAKWALMMQKKTLELAQECGDIRLQARALKALGVLFLDRNDPAKALDCQQQALMIATESRDQELEARVYANLGNLAAAQQQLQHAIACHKRDLETSTQLDSTVGQARAHRNLSLIFAKMDSARDEQLEHELQAVRLEAANAFETDMRRHAGDVVGNIYWQLTTPDAKVADMVASSLKEVLTTREDEEATSRTEQYIT